MPSVPFVPLALTVVIALLPAASILALGLWTRWVSRQAAAPRTTVRVAGALVAFAGLLLVLSIGLSVYEVFASNPLTTAQRTANLSLAVSEAMYNSMASLPVALLAALWLWFCTWIWHRAARRRLLVGTVASLAVLAASVAACLWLAGRAQRDPLAEATDMVQGIRVAQEAYHSEAQQYANISSALAANQATNHRALYPQAPREPGKYATAWGVPCWAQACNSAMEWSMLPLHVDGPVRFGYSTIAGRAGERPTAVVTVEGKPTSWPTPTGDWYIITAVGDVDGTGVFTTVMATSWDTEIVIDRGAK